MNMNARLFFSTGLRPAQQPRPRVWRVRPDSSRAFWSSLLWALAFGLVSPNRLAAQPAAPQHEAKTETARNTAQTAPCKVLADERLSDPIETIVGDYRLRAQAPIQVEWQPAARINLQASRDTLACDLVIVLAMNGEGDTPVALLPQARKVAWKHPSGEPVWAAVVSRHPEAAALLEFLGGPIGHRFWAESKAGFNITSGRTSAEAHEWVVEHRVKHTYPLTAARMLLESGGIRDGICLDLGCGSGRLDVELAKRTNLRIFGLDIDPDVKPFFEKTIAEAGLQDRVSFVLGDAQQLPFPNHYADLIVSRGALIFIPDIKKCLQEVHRVLKPTGVAFLGGRYLYTPHSYKISNEDLKRIVQESGVPGAQVIEEGGQWVKILGPKAPAAARQFQGGPQMLPQRFLAHYGIIEGQALLVCRGDGEMEQGLQQGFLDLTQLKLTALYPSEKLAAEAGERMRRAQLGDRITCRVGEVHTLPFEADSFDLVAGVGPILLWGDREKGMREIHRVLRRGGVALVGGRFLGMPERMKVSSEALRESAARTGLASIQVLDDMGQWVEIRK